MRAENYLERINKNKAIIAVKKEDASRWFNIAAGVGGFSSSDAVQSTKNPHKMADAVAKHMEINDEIKALEEEIDDIMKTLERLHSVEYMILIKFYVRGDSLKQIARFFDRSYDWSKKRKAAALVHLQAILDEKKD
jgi:DNA-directed RNA polymerase specialized sigma24 family protein